MFVGLPGLGTFAFAGYHDRAHAEVVQGVVDAFLAVAAVGSDGARCAPGSLGDPRDRRRQLRRVGGGVVDRSFTRSRTISLATRETFAPQGLRVTLTTRPIA